MCAQSSPVLNYLALAVFLVFRQGTGTTLEEAVPQVLVMVAVPLLGHQPFFLIPCCAVRRNNHCSTPASMVRPLINYMGATYMAPTYVRWGRFVGSTLVGDAQ